MVSSIPKTAALMATLGLVLMRAHAQVAKAPTPSATASPTAMPTAAEMQQIEQQLNCIDNSLWSDGSGVPQKGHDFASCNGAWGLRNANDANVLMEKYLQELETRVRNAKAGNDTAALADFRRDKICGENQTLDACYEAVRRRVLSHTVRIRENILNSNRILSELEVGGAAPLSSSSTQDDSIGLLDGIEALRKERVVGDRPCDANPFIPCSVTFGKGIGDATRIVRDTATRDLVTGAYGVSAVTEGRVRDGTSTKTVEMSDTRIGENVALRKSIESRLRNTDPGNELSSAEFESDLREEDARIQREIAAQKTSLASGPPRVDSRLPDGGAWGAFNSAMDSLSDQRRAAMEAGDLVNFYLRIEADVTDKTPGRMTTDTIIRDVLNTP